MASKLRSADTLIAPAVAETIKQLTLGPEDAAAVRLAERYAAAIDAAPATEQQETLDKLGPKLLAALESLGATPKARAALKTQPAGTGGRLEALRAARRA